MAAFRGGLLVCALAIGGCSVDREGLLVVHRDAGPADAALDAWPADSGGSLVEIGDDSFEDFRAGDLGASVANLYVRADGTVAPVLRWDVDGDGTGDVVAPSYFDGITHDLMTPVYLGGDGGFPEAGRVIELPTTAALGALAADLDGDGWTDVAFANHYSTATASYSVESVVYWGSAAGFAVASRTAFPTTAAYTVEAADLDHDGHLDLIVGSYSDVVAAPPVRVYWGDGARFASNRVTELAAEDAVDVCPADFDRNGWVDLFVTRYREGITRSTTSYLIPFDETGPLGATPFPTTAAHGCAVADLEADGYLDVIVTQFETDAGLALPSLVFHGTETGPSPSSPTEIDVSYPGRPRIADFDGDGRLDVLVPSSFSAGRRVTDSPVFFGDATGLRALEHLPGLGPYDADVRDFDGDGNPDVLLANRLDDVGSYGQPMYLYPGSPGTGFEEVEAELPGQSPVALLSRDWGDTYRRGGRELFVSRPMEMPDGASLERVAWEAKTPGGSAVRLQLRTAESLSDLETTSFSGPTGPEDWYDGTPSATPPARGRYVQYRAELRFTAAGGPRLERVTLGLREPRP